MLKTAVLFILLILTAVNLLLIWQIWRKMKQNMDRKLSVIEPYISVRLTVFGINTAIICVIGLARVFLQIFLHA